GGARGCGGRPPPGRAPPPPAPTGRKGTSSPTARATTAAPGSCRRAAADPAPGSRSSSTPAGEWQPCQAGIVVAPILGDLPSRPLRQDQRVAFGTELDLGNDEA